ncbi:hypothetical protein INP83_11340 [Mucilaginibacter sp. 21P]|uniref:hypothetical protein n=1 Tax=Mucilaginibacter sp. 21P TaxID=2778902 RepID=UPI001C586C93|nr:hypothetical protein [Mucilaginibacter sp. 21P]QXV63704.1 hypothetical protein INP83_11340 [Mucilaginibacter sp. 21P]
MKNLIPFLLIAFMGCQSNSKTGPGGDSIPKTMEVPLNFTGSFDLARLQLKENAPELLKAYQVKLEAVTDTDATMLGLERIKSRASEVLRYGGVNLSGSDGKVSNYAVFHYEENSKRLVFFQVILYTRVEAAALSKELEKMGNPVFEKKWPDGSLTLDAEGNAVQPKADEKQRFRVWEDKATGISRIYNIVENSHSLVAELTVIKRADKVSRDWMQTTDLDWYKKDN